MDSLELAEWMAYYSIEPWGYHFDNWRSGMVASQIANPHRKKGAKPFKPSDFWLDTDPNKRAPETVEDKLRAALGHRVTAKQ